MCQMPGKGNTKSHRSRTQRLPARAKGEKNDPSSAIYLHSPRLVQPAMCTA